MRCRGRAPFVAGRDAWVRFSATKYGVVRLGASLTPWGRLCHAPRAPPMKFLAEPPQHLGLGGFCLKFHWWVGVVHLALRTNGARPYGAAPFVAHPEKAGHETRQHTPKTRVWGCVAKSFVDVLRVLPQLEVATSCFAGKRNGRSSLHSRHPAFKSSAK